MENWKEIAKDLAAPFPEEDVIWRVQQSGKTSMGEIWAKVLAYIDNRAIMNRLDEVVGIENWQNRFHRTNGETICEIGIRNIVSYPGIIKSAEDEKPLISEWIWKADGAGDTEFEKVKGGLSNAMKRAAYQWGIGRYLYSLPPGWAQITTRDKARYSDTTKDKERFYWNPPALPEWALPKEESSWFKYLRIMGEVKKDLAIRLGKEEGEKRYYAILRAHGSEKANQIKDRKKQEAVYLAMIAELQKYEEVKE